MAETKINNHAGFIWSVADLLRGDYKQSEYGKVLLASICERYEIAELWLFDSSARGTARPDSDVDLLYMRPPASRADRVGRPVGVD
jgi:predicted nucleotidyltransferase